MFFRGKRFNKNEHKSKMEGTFEYLIGDLKMIITIELKGALMAKNHSEYKVLFEGKYFAVIWIL